MRRTIAVLALVALAVSSVCAQEEATVWWGSNYMPGNVKIAADLAYETISGYSPGLAAYPEFEVLVFKPSFGAGATGTISV